MERRKYFCYSKTSSKMTRTVFNQSLDLPVIALAFQIDHLQPLVYWLKNERIIFQLISFSENFPYYLN